VVGGAAIEGDAGGETTRTRTCLPTGPRVASGRRGGTPSEDSLYGEKV